jgi:PhnB protein
MRSQPGTIQRSLTAIARADQFWGDRFGSVQDPFGHLWSIATHVEDVPPEEMAERAKAAMAAMAS